MKKLIKKFSIIFLILFPFLFFPSPVGADEDLNIPRWVVESRLSNTGDLHIVEDITFEFKDDFNGVFREIVLDKTSGISDISVKEITQGASKKYVQVEDANKGDTGVFLVNKDTKKVQIQIFSPSVDQEKTFQISYVLKNVAIQYNDIGELYYKFLGSENETPIDNFIVNIELPPVTSKDQIKIFAHGPLNGKTYQRANNICTLQVENVSPKTYIEGRILFPKELIASSQNIIDRDNYTNILEEETAYRNNLIQDQERKEKVNKILGEISLLASIIGTILFVLFVILLRRDKNPYGHQDDTHIPEDCTPAIAAYISNNTLGSHTIMATLLDLFRKGYVKIDNPASQDENFIITQVKESDHFLLGHEKHFLYWLIQKIGNGKSVSTQDIKSFSKEHPTKFVELSTQWQEKIKKDVMNKGYYDKSNSNRGTFFLLYSILLFILGIFTLVYINLLGLVSLGVSALLFVYSIILFYRYSDYGYQQYKKWKNFKKYIKSLKKNTSIKDITQYPLDLSLIYALGLGVGEEFQGKLKISLKNSTNNIYYNDAWMGWYIPFMTLNNNTFQQSIHKSFNQPGSSFSAGGGNFTAGGGGGAGGGGAGGF